MPIVATTRLWNLLIAYLFLREREKVNARTALGTVAAVGGTRDHTGQVGIEPS